MTIVFDEATGYYATKTTLPDSETSGSFLVREHGRLVRTWDDWRRGTSGTGATPNRDTNAIDFGIAGGQWTSEAIPVGTLRVMSWDVWSWDIVLENGATATIEARSITGLPSGQIWTQLTSEALPLGVNSHIQFRVTVTGGAASLYGIGFFWSEVKIPKVVAAPVSCKALNLPFRNGIVNIFTQTMQAKSFIRGTLDTLTSNSIPLQLFVGAGRKYQQTVERRDDYGLSSARASLPAGGSANASEVRFGAGYTTAPNTTTWPIFDDSSISNWDSGVVNNTGVKVGLRFPASQPQHIREISVSQGSTGSRWSVDTVRVLGSNDGSTWTQILGPTSVNSGQNSSFTLKLPSNQPYVYVVVEATNGTLLNDAGWQINQMKFFTEQSATGGTLWSGTKFRKELYLDRESMGNGYVVMELGIDRAGVSSNDIASLIDPDTVGPIWVQVNGDLPIDGRSWINGRSLDNNLFRLQVPANRFVAGKNTIDVWSEGSSSDTLFAGLDVGPNPGEYPLSMSFVPQMTGPNTPAGYTVLASSQYDGGTYAAYRAFDRVLGATSNWNTSTLSFPCWLEIQLPLAKTLRAYSLSPREVPYTHFSPKAWEVQGWDGSGWVSIHSVSNQTAWGSDERRFFTVTSPGPYTRYRLYITENGGGGLTALSDWTLLDVDLAPRQGDHPGIDSFTVIDALMGSDVNTVPAMTGPNTPSGTAFASEELNNTTYAAWKAFNRVSGDEPDFYAANLSPTFPVTLGYIFPSPRTIKGYIVAARGNPSYTNQTPRDWTVESFDGVTWTPITNSAQAAQAGWGGGERRKYTFDTPVSALGFRLLITAHGGGGHCSVAELEWLIDTVSGAQAIQSALSSELRFWALTPEQRPIEDTLFQEELPASALIRRPEADLAASGVIYRTENEDLASSALIAATGFSTLPVSADIARPMQELPASAEISTPFEMPASAEIIPACEELPSSAYVVQPAVLPSDFTIAPYLELPAQGTVIRPYGDLTASATIKATFEMPANAYVTLPRDLSANCFVLTPSISLPASAEIVRNGEKSLNCFVTTERASETLPASAEVSGIYLSDFIGSCEILRAQPVTSIGASAVVERPRQDLTASADVGVRPTIPAEAVVVRPSADLSVSASIDPLGTAVLPVSAEIDRYKVDFMASAEVTDSLNKDLSAHAKILETNGLLATLSAQATVSVLRTRVLLSSASVSPDAEVAASAEIVRPQSEIGASAEIKDRKIADVIQDVVYVASNDSMGADVQNVLPLIYNFSDTIKVGAYVGVSPLDVLEYSASDGIEAIFEELPILKATGTTIDSWSLTDIGPTLAFMSDDNANWGPPTRLTNNLRPDEVVQNPFFGEVGGEIVVGFEMVDRLDKAQIVVVKTEALSQSNVWAPAKRLAGQHGSIAGGMLRFTGENGVYEWVPPIPGSEIYAAEASFTPIERTQHQEIALAWKELLYEMEKSGEIRYPPPQWRYSPIKDELIIAIHENEFPLDPPEVFPRNLETDVFYAQTTEDIIIG